MIKINKKKIIFVMFLFILICLICFIGSNIEVEKVDEINEINVLEEISEKDEKQINFIGYVLNTGNALIEKRSFIIDQGEVVEDMYKNILNKLVQKNEEEIVKTVNEIYEININRCEEENGVLSIYLNNDILEFEKLDVKDREYVINMINSTMLEINEIIDIRYFFNDKEYIANNV